MRITFVIPAYLPARAYGGPVTWTAYLAESLVQRGHDVKVLTSDIGPTPKERIPTLRENLSGVEVARFRTPLRIQWAGISPSFLACAGTEIDGSDLVHLISYRDGFGPVAASRARSRNIPYLFEPMGMVGVQGRSRGKKLLFDTLFLRGLIRGAAKVIVASRIETGQCLDAGVRKEQIAVIPNGIALHPRPDRSQTQAVRRKLGVPMDAKVVLNVGRINYRKGLPFVATCIRELLQTVEADVHFVLAGPDERDGTLEKVREHLGAHVHRLHTPGPVYDEEKWALFASADLFVLASPFAENFGIVAAEALAMGTPAFVSPICGVGDHIDDTCGAVLPLEKSAWTDSMRDVLTGRQSFDRDVVAAAANPLELHRVVDRQVAVYEEILNAGT